MSTNLDHLAEAVATRLRRTGHMEMLTRRDQFRLAVWDSLRRPGSAGAPYGPDWADLKYVADMADCLMADDPAAEWEKRRPKVEPAKVRTVFIDEMDEFPPDNGSPNEPLRPRESRGRVEIFSTPTRRWSEELSMWVAGGEQVPEGWGRSGDTVQASADEARRAAEAATLERFAQRVWQVTSGAPGEEPPSDLRGGARLRSDGVVTDAYGNAIGRLATPGVPPASGTILPARSTPPPGGETEARDASSEDDDPGPGPG